VRLTRIDPSSLRWGQAFACFPIKFINNTRPRVQDSRHKDQELAAHQATRHKKFFLII